MIMQRLAVKTSLYSRSQSNNEINLRSPIDTHALTRQNSASLIGGV